MFAFRRWAPALALVAAVGASNANAQVNTAPFNCTVTASNVPTLRAEGITELTGDLVLTCSGGNPTGTVPGLQFPNLVPLVNVQIVTSAGITSRIIGTATPPGSNLQATYTEAVLAIDDPIPTVQRACPLGQICPISAGPIPVGQINPFFGQPGIAVAPPRSFLNPTAGGPALPRGISYTDPTGVGTQVPNVFFGRLATGFTPGGVQNSIVWEGVPLDPPGTNDVRVIRISNVRVNATSAVSTSLLPAQILMAVSITGSPLNNGAQLPTITATQAVGVTAPGLAQTGDLFLSATSSSALATTGFLALQCNPTGSSSVRQAFRARFQETFPTAFKLRFRPSTSIAGQTTGYSVAEANNPVTQNLFNAGYATESGQYFFGQGSNPLVSSNGQALAAGISGAGLADSGTRLYLRFTDVPDGVSIFVSATNVDFSGSTVVPVADANANIRLVSTDPSGANPIAFGATQIIAIPGDAGITGAGGVAIAQIPVASRTATAVYEVFRTNSNAIEAYDVAVDLRYTQTATTPQLGTARVSQGFAPISNDVNPRGFLTTSGGAPIPRFIENTTSRNAFVVNECNTSLLFPFVTNRDGFDTGMVIANTSQDQFGTAPQGGNCRLEFYGEGANGQPIGSANAVSNFGPLAAGQHAAFTLSSGGAIRNVATGTTGLTQPVANAGFQGYVIARCGFLYGHGYAFITDGFMGRTEVAQGYLALVLNPGGVTRNLNASESLGN